MGFPIDRNGASPAGEGFTGYAPRRNFGDASYEPTDDDLAELMREAFAEVRATHDDNLRRLHERIRERGRILVAELMARRSAGATR